AYLCRLLLCLEATPAQRRTRRHNARFRARSCRASHQLRPCGVGLTFRVRPAPTPRHRSGLAATTPRPAPGAVMLTLPPSVQIWCATTPTDLRRGFDGLAALVRTQLRGDLLSGHLFVFFNKKADRLKILYWDRDGLVLWYKRLERGRYHFPAADAN